MKTIIEKYCQNCFFFRFREKYFRPTTILAKLVFFFWGKENNVVFSPPQTCQKFCEFLRVKPKTFFGETKVILQFRKKNDFDGKPKMTKISRFENFEIEKNGQISPFWKKLL